MKKRTISILAFVVALGSVGASLALNQTGAQMQIEGIVTDKQGNPIPSVQVRAYRGKRAIPNPIRTDQNGTYRLAFPVGAPIDVVRYDHSGWHAGTIIDVSGDKSHLINKVLYQPQATMSLGAALTQLATYERLYFLDPRDELLRRDYASKIASIEPDQPEDDAGFKFARMVKNRAEDLEDLLRNLKN